MARTAILEAILLLSMLLPACVSERTKVTIEKRPHLWDSYTAVDETGTFRLAGYKDWIYLQESPDKPYIKLLPGICPQWLPKHKGQEDRWFYLFLPVGYDSMSELWIGSTRGKYLGKAAEGLFCVNSTPTLSPDGKALASVLRPLVQAQGDLVSVSVIWLNSRISKPSTQTWVYKDKGVSIEHLEFKDATTLTFTVLAPGKRREETLSISPPQQHAPLDRAERGK
ncbi:MAG: hypothetical protein ACYTE3_20415 [Planctomycetota bacterium]|jgi:hypothetical protein